MEKQIPTKVHSKPTHRKSTGPREGNHTAAVEPRTKARDIEPRGSNCVAGNCLDAPMTGPRAASHGLAFPCSPRDGGRSRVWEAQWRHLPANGLAPWIGGQAPTRARTRQGSGHSVLRAQSAPATPRVEIQNEMKLPGEAGQGAAGSWRGLARVGLLLLEAATAVLGLESLEKRERLAAWTSDCSQSLGAWRDSRRC